MIAPGSWLGMLGGGQLGRMFCFAAHALGYRVAVLDPDPASPAGHAADRHVRAAFDDPHALGEFAALCSAITTEFENVPAPTLAFLAQLRLVAPNANAVGIAQDRIAEKRFIASCGIDVAPHAVIAHERDIDALNAPLLPGILKAARLGYDGKGQARVASIDDVRRSFAAFGAVPCVLERRLDLAYEISVVCARDQRGDTAVFPAAENVHRDGILAISRIPGTHTQSALSERAAARALEIVRRLEYVGVLCVEFFVLTDGQLLVNEMAPRPHNSGHYTIDACTTDQFEQQVRALAGLPLGATTQHSAAVMLNLLGDVWFDVGNRLREPNWSHVLALPGTHLHLYGKTEPRRARKMGHLTCTGRTRSDAERTAAKAAALLGIAI